MFTALLAVVAFVVGAVLDKILFLFTVLFLWNMARAMQRKACIHIARRWARLRHRMRHVFGRTVIYRS